MESNYQRLVSSLAGVTEDGYKDGDALNAKFRNLQGITFQNGNLIVADFGNNRIRKIDTNGLVTTLAGDGTVGSTDGNLLSAKFDGPIGVTSDNQGNIIVAEFNSCRIRKICSDGYVRTIAGSNVGYADGRKENAQFFNPRGVAVDHNGNIIVCDQNNNTIRRIDPNGNVTTLAGDTDRGYKDGKPAKLNGPMGLVVDKDGNIIFADYNNNCIRKLKTNGQIITLAGDGKTGFADGKRLEAKFNRPTSVALDKEGNIIVTDYNNHCIRMIDENGEVTTIAGDVSGHQDDPNSTTKFTYPIGVTLDPEGNIYVTDNNRILKITAEAKKKSNELQLKLFLKKLLVSEQYSDFSIYAQNKEFRLHKALLSVRCPSILQMKSIDLSPSLFHHIVDFIYTNHIDQTINATTTLLLLSTIKFLKIPEFRKICQKHFLTLITNQNVFDLILTCHKSPELSTELDWLLWFVGKNKLPLPEDSAAKLAETPELLVRLFSEVVNITLPPPPEKFKIEIIPLEEMMTELYISKGHCDFSFRVGDRSFDIHRCILGLRWLFFSSVLLRGGSGVEHVTAMPESTFGKLIEYFYTGKVGLFGFRDCCWILSLEDYYLLHEYQELLEYCHGVLCHESM